MKLLLPFIFTCQSMIAGNTPDLKSLTGNPPQAISFIENKGQIADQDKSPRNDIWFSGRTGELNFFLRNNGVSYQLNKINRSKNTRTDFLKEKGSADKRSAPSISIYRVDISWTNCNSSPEVAQDEQLPELLNFYTEAQPSGVTGVRSYKGVWYKNIYEKTDLHYYSADGKLEYDFLIRRGGDYRNIRLRVEGAQKISLQKDGSLLLRTPFGTIEEGRPVVYQAGKRIPATWIVNGNELTFNIPAFDHNLPLLIDPVTRLWGTYYGGSNSDSFLSSATNSNNDLLVTGRTGGAAGNIIATTGSHQQTFAGAAHDGFIALFNSSGVRQWATYYGGSGLEEVTGCAFDASGNIAVSGFCELASASVMTTSSAYQTTHGGAGSYDIFLARFTSAGVRTWGTLYGGAGNEISNNCNFDNAGNIIVAGYTKGSSDAVMSSAGAHQTVSGGISGTDGFVVKFDAAGSRVWGTLYGGPGDDSFYSCDVSASGDIVVSGLTRSPSTTIIATPGSHQPNYAGNDDALLVKFNSAGVRQWGTYYGGTNSEQSYGISIDTNGDIVFTGDTKSTTGISTSGVHQPVFGGVTDLFVAKFNSTGTRLWGTYYGGSNYDDQFGCSLDPSGNIYISGTTNSTNGNSIATLGSWQTTYGGAPSDAFLVKLSASGIRQWGTYYGGAQGESSYCIADGAGDVYLFGVCSSPTGTVIASALSHQPVYGGGIADGFIAKFGGCTTPAPPVVLNSPASLEICSTTQPTLVVSSPNTAWYNSAVFGTPVAITNTYMPGLLAAGTYTWYAEAFDCQTNTSRTPVSLTVVAMPTLAVVTDDPVICAGETVTLTASGASSYSWSNGGTGPLAQVSPTSTTIYTVTGLNGSCSVTSTFNQEVDVCESLTELNRTHELQLYPNPNNGTFFIEGSPALTLSVINVLGETILKKQLSSGLNGITISEAAGVYLVVVSDSLRSTTYRVVKE